MPCRETDSEVRSEKKCLVAKVVIFQREIKPKVSTAIQSIFRKYFSKFMVEAREFGLIKVGKDL